MHKHYYLIGLLTALMLLLFTAPASAAANPKLTSLQVSVAGVDKNIPLNDLTTEYSVSIQTDAALSVTIKATAASDCSVYLKSGRTQQPLPQTLTVTPGTTTSLPLIVVNVSGQKTTYQLNLITTPAANQGPDTGDTEPNPGPTADENTDNTIDPPQEEGPGDQTPADDGQTVNPGMTHLIMYINAPFYFLNDVYRDMDAAPYLVTDAKGGYTMVPLRFVAESLGAKVSWQAATKTVGIDLDGKHFQLVIGQLVPGTPVAATIVHDRTFVPLRYVMESFGALVFWTQNEKRIDIYYAPDSTA